MARKIFINYRRGDSSPTAGRLRDRLVRAFGENDVFMDVESIPAGVDFLDYLKSQVASFDTFLVLIGPDWLAAKDQSGRRRIESPDDPVTMEITTALNGNGRVIPVTIDGARMPTADELPSQIKPLARRNAIEVRNTHFGNDVDSLIKKIGGRNWWDRWPVKSAGVLTLMLFAVGIGFLLQRTASKSVAPRAPTAVAPPPAASPGPTAVAPPPKTQPPAAPVQPPSQHSDSAIAKFTLAANLDIYGQDIPSPSGQIGITDIDLNECASQCDSKESCVAFSFDRWKKVCYLKSKVVTPLLDPQSLTAVKKERLNTIPNRSTAPFKIELLLNRRFGVQPNRRTSVSNFSACKAACNDDQNCVAFSFLKNARTADNCQIFRDPYQGPVADSSTDSGYKSQSP